MNILLVFFAFPIAAIIVSAILQKILNNPVSVASLIFAIFLVITFAFFDETFLIATLIYTIIALITALLVRFFYNRENSNTICENLNDILQNLLNSNQNSGQENVVDTVEDIINNNSNNCGCNRYRRRF